MPHSSLFRGRRAAAIENNDLRLTVVEGGGHIAEVFHKASGVSPLWIPPWPSIEPRDYVASATRPTARVSNRNCSRGSWATTCVSISSVGHPTKSTPPVCSRMARHPSSTYQLEYRCIRDSNGRHAVGIGLRVERRLHLDRSSPFACRIGGKPFRNRPAGCVDSARDARSAVPGKRSNRVPRIGDEIEGPRNDVRSSRLPDDRGDLRVAARAARSDGGTEDLRTFTERPKSGAYTAHLMDPNDPDAYLRRVFSDRIDSSFGYVWKQKRLSMDGHLGRKPKPPASAVEWAHHDSRNGIRRFSVSGIATRDDRARTFYSTCRRIRWIPARTRVDVDYWIVCRSGGPDSRTTCSGRADAGSDAACVMSQGAYTKLRDTRTVGISFSRRINLLSRTTTCKLLCVLTLLVALVPDQTTAPKPAAKPAGAAPAAAAKGAERSSSPAATT